MSDKPSIPSVLAGAAPGVIVTSYPTANIPSACLSRREEAEKKIQKGGSCTASFKYYLLYPDKTTRGNLTNGTLSLFKDKIAFDGTSKKFISPEQQLSIPARFQDIASLVATWRAPLESEENGPKKIKTIKPSGLLLGKPLEDQTINFIVLGTIASTPRKLLLTLAELPRDKREIAMKVIGNLKIEAEKKENSEHQAQKERARWLLSQLNSVKKVEEFLIKDVKGPKEGLIELARLIVVTTNTEESDNPQVSASEFLRDKLNQKAKLYSKGITLFTGNPSKPEETISDPYKFFYDRLSPLTRESAYQNAQAEPTKLLTKSLSFLETAVKEKWAEYIKEDEVKAFTLSLKTYVTPANIEFYLKKELPGFPATRIGGWRGWLNTKVGEATNLQRVTEALVGSARLKETKEGKIVELDLTLAVTRLSRLTPQLESMNVFKIADQQDTFLTAVAVLRAMAAQLSQTTSTWLVKPTVRVWLAKPIGFSDLSLRFINGQENDQKNFESHELQWLRLADAVTVTTTLPSSEAARIEPPPTFPRSQEQRSDLIPEPGTMPIAPLTPRAKLQIAAPWMTDGALGILGLGLLGGGLTAGNAADQGDYRQGNIGLTVSGSMILSASLVAAIAGAIHEIVQKQTKSPRTLKKDFLAHGIGAAAGLPLGLLSLIRFYGNVDPTGGGDTQRNPGEMFGPLTVTIPLP